MREKIMKKHIIPLFIISSLILFLPACSPDTVQLAQQYPIIYNTHNVKDIVRLYSDDAIFEIAGQFTLKGKDQLRDITKYDSVLNIKMHVFNLRSTGDTVWYDLSETNDWLQVSGIGDAHYTGYFIFENGLIKKLGASAKPETQQAFGEVLSALMAWANENSASVLSEMMPEGKFIYNAVNAEKNLKLMRSWKESQK